MKTFTEVHIHYTGRGIGKKIVVGTARVIKDDSDWQELPENPIVIVTTTTPRMLPYLDKVKGIIAEQAGLTSHAALVSRELQIPAIVAVTNATSLIKNGQIVTLDCVSGGITVGKEVNPDLS